MISRYLVLLAAPFTAAANAGDSTLDAAIGGGIGGAAGAAIGNEVGGREGAIVGGVLGGAVGAAVTTDSESHETSAPGQRHYEHRGPSGGYPGYTFCPPGQAEKGRC